MTSIQITLSGSINYTGWNKIDQSFFLKFYVNLAHSSNLTDLFHVPILEGRLLFDGGQKLKHIGIQRIKWDKTRK